MTASDEVCFCDIVELSLSQLGTQCRR